MEENKRGGVRPNSGRKKVGDKKVQFVVYVPKSWLPKEAAEVMRLRERVVDFIESDRNPILSQNKPVEGNVRKTDDVSNLGRKKRSDDKKYENNVKDAGNWTGDVDVAAKIEELQRAANSCADTKLGKLAKAGYLKQITELQSLLKLK